MLKVMAITKPPKYFYRIGENIGNAFWYSFENLKDGTDYPEVSTGDLVEIESKKEGKDTILTSIKVTGKAPAKTSTGTSGWRSKSPEESESIRKQAVGKMVAETVKGVEGVTQANVEDLVNNLYLRYNELTK